MAIFTDEFLTDNPVEGNPNIEEALGSPLSGPEPGPTYSGMGESASMSREGLSGEQLSKIATLPGQGGGVNLIPLSEVAANKRYNTYVRGMDLENIYGMQQSAFSQLGNSVVKMAGLAAGTFVQGFATIPDTISAMKNGKMADLSGGPDSYESAIDDWTKNIEDYFPNYYTRKEKESPYLAMIPFMPGSANFWGDKIIKNIGFTAGAIGSAIVQDAIIGTITDGIGAAPLIASQLGKASLFINKLYAGATKVDKVLDLARTVGKTGEQILNIKRLGEIAAGTKVLNGFRYSMGIYGSSRTEAAIEARDGYRQVKDELLKEYKIENAGREPSPSDLAQIENYATDAMNTRFGINMALLTASNTIQFGNLFKSFTSASKGLSGQLTRDLEDIGKIGLKEGSLDVFEKKTAETIGGRVWDSVRPKFANILAEGVYEEGGQYAAEKGTYDYFTRKYKNLSNPLYKDNWNTTVEAVDSTVKGLKDQFGTSEGLENMIVGAISAMLTGGIMGRIDNAKGGGSDARLNSTINILNQYGLTGILSNQFDSTLTSAGIAAEMNEAVKNKDIFKYKNLKDDMFFDYVSSRLPSGMHDVTIEQLKMLKDLSKEEFEKTFGMDFSSSNKSTVSEYVDALIDQANNIKDTHDSIDATFNNPFKSSINPKTPEEISENLNHTVFNKWKEELAYNASKIPSINSRLDSIQQSVFEINPQLTNSMLAQLTNKESLKDLSKNYEESASQLNKTITEFTTPADSKKIKDRVKALRTASEKINLGLSTNVDTKLFEYLLNFEVNNQTPTDTKIVGPEWISDLFNYGHDINRHNELKVKVSKIFDNLSSEKGFDKYFDEAKEMQAEVVTSKPPTVEQVTPTENLAPAFKNKSGQQEPIELNREYQIPASKKARVDKIADDRWQVTEPNGNITFYPSKEKADVAVAELNEQFGNLQKVKIVAINADGTVKVEDINGDIYNINLSTLEGYEKIKSSQEKLLKDKNDIDAQQAEIENKSGDTFTGVPQEDDKKIVYEDGFRKILSRIFTTTTAQSEADPTKLIPSSKRANIFRNNLKNFNNRSRIRLILVTQKQEAALGLEGLANLSMGSVGIHTDVDNGFVAAVYVEQDGDNVYFVNEKGERTGKVGEKIALDKMIFDTMPSTSLSTPTGLRFDNKTTKEEDVQELANQWRAKREQLLNLTGSPEMYKFDLSRGIPKIGNKDARNAVGKTLVSEDLISTQQGLIVIPTTKTITHQGETINFPNGRPVLQYEDTLQPLNNRKFNKKEADAIFLVMQYLCDSIKEQSEKGQKVKIDRNFATFLQSVLYYRKSADTAKNQFYIDTATMEFFFSGKRYDITKIAESKDAITTQLLDVYNNVNNYTLTKEFDANFKEYYINDNGKLTINTWENYQTYLMSSTYPNGKARPEQEIPLTTNVDKITDLAPTNYKAKYSILQGLELPQVVIAPVAPVAPAPVIITPAPIVTPVVEPVVEKVLSDDEKVLTFITAKISGSLPGSYDLDGDDFKFTAGNIRFTAKLNDKGKYDVIVNADDANNRETIDKIKATPASMVAINNFIEAGKPKAPEAPAPVVETETPVSTDAKAAIERRRRELTTFTSTRNFIKGVNHSVAIAKKQGRDGFDVDVSNKADVSTGFLYSKSLSEHFDTIEEAIEYANEIIQGDKEYIKKVDAELAALEAKPSTDAKADIERRRQEALIIPNTNVSLYDSVKKLENGIKDITNKIEKLEKEGKGTVANQRTGVTTLSGLATDRERLNDVREKELAKINEINAKYDAELKALKESSTSTDAKAEITSEQWDEYYGTKDGKFEDGKVLAKKFYNPLWAAIDTIKVKILNLPDQFISVKQGSDSLKKYGFSDVQIDSLEKLEGNTLTQKLETLNKRVSGMESTDISQNRIADFIISEFKNKEVQLFNSVTGLNYGTELAALEEVKPVGEASTEEAKIRKEWQQELKIAKRFLNPYSGRVDLGGVSVEGANINLYDFLLNAVPTKQLKQIKEDIIKLIKSKSKKSFDVVNFKEIENSKEIKEYLEYFNINKINTKYQAKLAALEGTKPIPPKGKKKLGNKPPASGDYRKVGRNEEAVEKMSDLDLQLFKEWHAKNAPTIPYEVLDGVIRINDTEKAWGAFEAGVAKFYKGAIRGTEYHEIFEGIWKAFLTSEQRQNILDEFKSQKGTFLDRESGKRISYDEATDLQAKERIADDFSEFRLGKLPGRTLKEKILKFFRDIINFFKSFVQKPSLKEDLFKSINKGKFKKSVISESVKNEPIEYSKIGNLTETQSYNFVQDITARVFQIIFSTNKSLYNLENINSGEIFNQIKNTYLEYGVIDDLDPDQLTSSEFDELVEKTKEFLRVFKIDFDYDGDASFNDDSRDKNEYASSPFVTDWKKLSPFAIKIVLASLTETVSTNQENNLLNLPDLKTDDDTGTFKLLNFSRAFATCLNQFANTTDVNELVNKLGELAKDDSNYVRLYKRLGGVTDTEKAHINFKDFKMDDWRLFINFYQTFSKQKPDALVQYINGGDVYTATANLFEAKKEIKSNWIENLKGMIGEPDSLISRNYSTNAYEIKTRKKDKNDKNEPNGVLDFPIRSTEDKIAFLAKLGIEFPIEAYRKLKTKGKTNQVDEFGKAVSAIREYFGSNQDILSFTGKTLGVNAQYDKLAELLIKVTNPNQELSFFGIDQKKIQAYAENNAISVLENDFNSCNTLDELLTLRPELTDLFSKKSVVLKKGGLFFNSAGKRIRDLKVAYIQGTSNADLEKDVVTASLTFGNRYVQQLNQNLTGNYYVLVPADSSIEWMMNLGNIVKFADVESQKGKPAREQVHEIFMGYLEDDIALALADRKELINVAPRAKELRFFNDILSKELLKEVNQLIADDANTDQVSEFLKNNTDKINDSIDAYIKVYNDATIQTLKDTKRVVINSKNDYKFIDLDKDFALSAKLDKQSLSEKELNDIVMFANVNYIINNIEFHKLLFGDPYQFAIKDGQLDETKRVKAFLSGRRKMFNTPEFNTFLNQTLNQAGTIEEIENNEGIKLKGPDANNPDDFGDPGYHLNKDYANTVTFDDVKIIGSVATLDNIPPEIQKAYAKEAKETDGISFLMDGAYKEIKLKNGQWPREAEEWHQWQMAYTRQNFPGYVYKDNALEAHDKALVSKSEPKFMIDVLKPIVSGNEHNSTSIKIVLDKFSQMPLYFSMVKGTNLERMYVNMFKQQVDYAVVLSGRKVGAGASHAIYNKDASFNETKYNNNVKVSWASYGIQVENAYQEGKQQTRGSQITKLVSIDIFDNGVATSERAQEEYTRNKKLLGLLHKYGYESFLKKLGIIDLGDGFKLINNTAVSETLIHEMLRRALSTNAKSTVKLNEDNQFPMPFEASTSYLQIREILFSMVDKAILSPKVNGSPHVQVPITGWENMGDRELLQKKDGKWKKITKEKYLKLSDEEKRKVAITDTTLRFYTREQPYCEILLPHWFKEKLSKNSKFKDDKTLLAYLNNTNEGRKILSGIGFRIPTQSLSSMEVFRVKGFLPQSMGSTVVVPSEIVTKAGSDFDIDKLNMYLKSIYIDVNGNIKLVEYKGSEEATREFYSNLFDEKLSKKIVTKEDLREAARILTYGEEDTEKLLEKYGSLLDIILDDYQSSDDYIDAMDAQLNELGDTNLQEQLKEKFVDDMYKRSLENEYFDSLEKLITLPENFDRLLSPVNDAGLEDVSKELDDLAGIDETNIPNRLLNRNYMTSLRHAFVIAKRWVSIAAVNITGQSLAQKSQVYIDPNKFAGLSKSDKKILGNGEIALPHNTTKVDGVDRVSISGVKTADGKHYISSRLSGYITSFVDVAKNPYILKIIKSNLIVSTFMFLERIGVGENAAFFLNQPIISDYLKYLDSVDSKTLFNYKNIKFIKDSYGSDSSGEFDISLLKENITNGASANKAQQVAIFDEFLKYAKMAEFSFKLTQASNYDTSKIRSSGALLKKRILTDKARKSNIFSSVDNILNNSFIAEQSSFASKSFEALGEVLKFDQPKFRNIINKVLTPFASREFMSDDDYARIENKIVTSFIDYVIQIKSSIGSEIKELLISPDTSVAAQLVKAKQDYPDMKIINDLQVASSQRLQNGAKSIKLGVNIKEAYDEDIYIGMMRELRDTEDLNSLYRNILKVAILQGTYQSAISIKNIIPIEDYSAEVAPIISKLTDDLDVQAFAKGWFQRNNFKGDDVFKTASPKFFHTLYSYDTGPVPIRVDNFGNETYLYYSYAFPVVDSLGIGGLDRKILVLSETFNYLDVQNDYVKVIRVVTDGKTGEKIDMITGETVTPSMYSEAKKKGDLSLKNIYGYEKVKHDDGTPLTFITDYEGEEMVNHVYKLINLYGENPYVIEHHSTFEPSEIDNGTIKIENEIPNADIIKHFVDKYPSQALQSEFAEEATEAVIVEPITNFYESLTPEQKAKLGPIEDVIADYESIPFDYPYEDYIESLNCKL